jgi:periplasmic divalent cation tolerance protein
MEKMTLILSNFASPESAMAISRILMQENLVTCVNMMSPHRAFYPWHGKIQEDTETAVYFKAPYDKKEALLKRLRQLHPYELPGLIVLEAEANADYALWLSTPQHYDQ